MKARKINKKNNDKLLYNITKEGSLGLLALGDVGLLAWREVKKESFKKSSK